MSLRSKLHEPGPAPDPESEDSIYNKSTPTYDLSEAETQVIDFDLEEEDGFQGSPAARAHNQSSEGDQTREESIDITEMETQLQSYNAADSEEDSISSVPTPPMAVHLVTADADADDESDVETQPLVVNQNPADDEAYDISNLETQPQFLDSEEDMDTQDESAARLDASDVHDLETQPLAMDRDRIEESIDISCLETQPQHIDADSSDIRDRTKHDSVSALASRLSTTEVDSNDESDMGSQTQPLVINNADRAEESVDISCMETQPQFLDSDNSVHDTKEDSRDSDISATQPLVLPSDSDNDDDDACSPTQRLVIDPEDSNDSVMSATQPLIIPVCVDINSSNDDEPPETKPTPVPVNRVDDDSRTQPYFPEHSNDGVEVVDNESRSSTTSSAAQAGAKKLFGTKRDSVLKLKVPGEQLKADDSNQEDKEDEDATPPISPVLDTSDVDRTPPVSPVLAPSTDEDSTPSVSPILEASNVRDRTTPLHNELLDNSDSIIEPTPRPNTTKTKSTSIQQSRSYSPEIFTASRHHPIDDEIPLSPVLEVKPDGRTRQRHDTDASTVIMEEDRISVRSCSSPLMFEDDEDSSAIPETQSPVFSYPCVGRGIPSQAIIDETRQEDDESDSEEDDNQQANCSPPKRRKVVRRSDLNATDTSAVTLPLREASKQRTSTPDDVLMEESTDTSDVDMGDDDFDLTFPSQYQTTPSSRSPASVSSARAASRSSPSVREEPQPSLESPLLRVEPKDTVVTPRKADVKENIEENPVEQTGRVVNPPKEDLKENIIEEHPVEPKDTVVTPPKEEVKENIIIERNLVEQKEKDATPPKEDIKEKIVLEENPAAVQEVIPVPVTRRSNRRPVANPRLDPSLYDLSSKNSETIAEEVEIPKRTRGGRKKAEEDKVEPSVPPPAARGRKRANVKKDVSNTNESIPSPVVVLKASSELKPTSPKKPMMEDVPACRDQVPSAAPLTDQLERSDSVSSNNSVVLKAGPSRKRPARMIQEDPSIIKSDNYNDPLQDQSKTVANGDDNVNAHKTRLRATVGKDASGTDPKSLPSSPGNKLVGEVDEKALCRSKTDASEENIDRPHNATTQESSGVVSKARRGRPRKVPNKNVEEEKSVLPQPAPSTDTLVAADTVAAQVSDAPRTRIGRTARSNKTSNENDTTMDASSVNESVDSGKTPSGTLRRGRPQRKKSILEPVKTESAATASPPISRRKRGAQESHEAETADVKNESVSEAGPSSRRLNRTRSTSTDCNQNEEPSRRRTRRALVKPVKIMFTGKGISDDENLHDIVIFLGGEIVANPTECSILVTDKIRRTVKFLCTVGLGLPIVSPDWLERSKANGRFLNPWDHLLKDAEGETKWNFNLGDSLEEASQQSMLEEYVFTVSAAVRPEPDEMADIISSCKGQYVKEFIGDPAPGEKRIAISAETSEDKRRWRIWAARKAVIVKAEAILSGVLRQKFEPDNFKLG